MLITLNTDHIDLSDRQVLDTIKTRHDARHKADIERLARDCMARSPSDGDEPRVPRRPAHDRMNTDGRRP